MVPEYKKELLDYSLNQDKLGFFKGMTISTAGKILSRLYSVEIFRNTDRMKKYIDDYYNKNNIKEINKIGVMKLCIYLMLKHLFGKASKDTPENVFNKMKNISEFIKYMEDKHDELIKVIDDYLNLETLYQIIDEKDNNYKRFKELSNYLIETHYRVIASVEVTLRPRLYSRINQYCKQRFNTSFIPYPTPYTLSEYMVEIVKSISEKDINGRFIESSLPVHLKEYLLAYEKLIEEYISIRNQYLSSN